MTLTHQEIFDISTTALLKQGKAAFEPYFGCRYRTTDGLKCAVGHLIPDDAYVPEMEGNGVDGAAETFPAAFANLETNAETLDLLRRLQGAHDLHLTNEDPDRWCMDLKVIAKDFNLSTKVLDQ